ncbi:hypothetical protein HNR61_008721 [Actinomadura namibiensis]|uniref:Uncharacterized protein n=1 Tax=Actinomadura namibiensis TaxID=182080 RepID=A0A7W3LZ56_ACTNM|nr:hypothetical protein [Actinomadura namibiensis]MBA8957031.1 hypothetical protein [Actinomadura namibiensis]
MAQPPAPAGPPPAITERPVRDEPRDRAGAAWSGGPPPAAHQPARPVAVRTAHTRRRFERRVVLLGAGSALAVSAVTLTLFTAMSDETAPVVRPGPAATPTATATLTRKVPPGWSATGAWQTPIRPGTRPAVIPDGGLVAMVTTDRRVQIRHGATGAVIWTAATPLPPEAGDPVATRVDGKPVITALAGPRLLVWPVNGTGAAPTTLALPDKAQVSWAGDGPLLTLPGHRAALVTGGQARTVELPGKAVAMAVDGSTVLAATSTGTWWRLTPGAPPVKVTPKKPAGAKAVTRVAAAGHGTVTLVWSSDTSGKAVAALHDATTGAARTSASAPADQLRTTPVWVRGADGGAAALGPVVFDLARPAATARPGLIPLTTAGPVAYGRIGKRLVAVPASGEPVRDLGAGTALPWGTVADRAIVADRTADGVALFALPAAAPAG